MTSFIIEKKKIEVFPGIKPDSPLICLNTYGPRRWTGIPTVTEFRIPGFYAGRCQ